MRKIDTSIALMPNEKACSSGWERCRRVVQIVSQWRRLCYPVSKSLVCCVYCLLSAVRSCRHTYLIAYIHTAAYGIPCSGSSAGSRVICQPEWRALRIGVQITSTTIRDLPVFHVCSAGGSYLGSPSATHNLVHACEHGSIAEQ